MVAFSIIFFGEKLLTNIMVLGIRKMSLKYLYIKDMINTLQERTIHTFLLSGYLFYFVLLFYFILMITR